MRVKRGRGGRLTVNKNYENGQTGPGDMQKGRKIQGGRMVQQEAETVSKQGKSEG